MTHRYCVEALNRTLQDITRNKNLFGGKTILFSGDWRQIGPVTKGSSSPTDTVDVAFISSHLWNHVQRLRLTISQRDKEDPQYADFVQRVGENKIPLSEVNEQPMMPLNNHCLPNTDDHFQLQFTTDFNALINFVYPNINEDSKQWNDRAILATTNHTVDCSNKDIASRTSGQFVSFLSSISLISDESNSNTAFADPQHLNQFNVTGVPPHDLKLKSNTLAMLVRNINFSEGLVNGQKCILHAISPNSRVIQAELLTEESPHPIVFIPRINFTAQVGRKGISFSRVQYPLRAAYSMSINKSQGQSLSKVGLDLIKIFSI